MTDGRQTENDYLVKEAADDLRRKGREVNGFSKFHKTKF